jgi:hypothetical protein
MKYLMRAARRLASAEASSVRPAIPSRSPVAEADQRLNVDSIAGRFEAPVPQARPEPSRELAEPWPVSGSDGEVEGRPEPGPPPSPAAELAQPVIPARRPGSRNVTRPSVPRNSGRQRSASTSSSSTTRLARAHERADGSDPHPLSVRETTTAQPDRERSVRPALRRNGLPDPGAPATRNPHLGQPRMKPVGAAREAQPAREEAAKSVEKALNRAMSWVTGQARRSGASERAEDRGTSASRPPRTRHGETPPARPVRTAPRDTRPITHLEIGTIEVDIAPPVSPTRHAASRLRPATTGSGTAWRPPFGWRQR